MVKWAVDNNYQVVETDTYPLIGGNTVKASIPWKFQFAQFTVESIATYPADLRIDKL